MLLKYNMILFEAVGMKLTRKNFPITTVFMHNEQAFTYEWVSQQLKKLYFDFF